MAGVGLGASEIAILACVAALMVGVAVFVARAAGGGDKGQE